MGQPARIVHYVNQFFGGIGGEEKAHTPLEVREGPVGPGRALQQILGAQGTVVATLICGDDYAAEREDEAGAAIRRGAGAPPPGPRAGRPCVRLRPLWPRLRPDLPGRPVPWHRRRHGHVSGQRGHHHSPTGAPGRAHGPRRDRDEGDPRADGRPRPPARPRRDARLRRGGGLHPARDPAARHEGQGGIRARRGHAPRPGRRPARRLGDPGAAVRPRAPGPAGGGPLRARPSGSSSARGSSRAATRITCPAPVRSRPGATRSKGSARSTSPGGSRRTGASTRRS